MYSTARILVAVLAVLIILAGLTAVAAGQPGPGLWAVLLGAVGLAVVALERTRYRSDTADRRAADGVTPAGGEDQVPQAPFQPTDETFLDPTTRRRMRVYLDPRTGERRYHAEP
jgi:hypothetical protein